jgi:serine/threonine protein kinase
MINPSIKDMSTNNNSMNTIFDHPIMEKNTINSLYTPTTYQTGPLINTNNNSHIQTNNSHNSIMSHGDTGSVLINEIISNQKERSLSSDHSLLGDIGYSFIISDKLLGHGSYGDVFLATDENGKQVAVKCCDIDNTGIPNILEASIMGSMVHPYLNRALRIQASDTKLYIIQDLALTDLAQYTRRDKGNHKPSMEELRKWCYCLAHAVLALHREDIIHADIKASNVLLYSDGSIRLTDYTLATKKWTPGEKFTHNVCTCTHRPLECLMRRSWDESLDIWSLGCTFYEIAYGELLFPYQGVLEPDQKAKDKDAKTRLRNRSVNAIIDWSSRGPNFPTSFEIIGTTQFPIDYIPFVLCEDFNKSEMNLFNDMICRMLTVDPAKRPTIDQVVSHPFFQGIKAPIYLSVRRPINKITLMEQARVTRYIQRYTDNKIIETLALNIYCRCNDLHTISEHVKSAVCTWIASKIVIGYPPTTISLPPNQILSVEREICHNLLFRLHSI